MSPAMVIGRSTPGDCAHPARKRRGFPQIGQPRVGVREHILDEIFGDVVRHTRDEHPVDRAAESLVELPECLMVAAGRCPRERGTSPETVVALAITVILP